LISFFTELQSLSGDLFKTAKIGQVVAALIFHGWLPCIEATQWKHAYCYIKMYDLKKGIEISFNDKLLKYWEDTRQAY